MSELDPIVLIDVDENADLQESKQNGAAHLPVVASASSYKYTGDLKNNISMFMDVTGCTDQETAKSLLEHSGNDIELAISSAMSMSETTNNEVNYNDHHQSQIRTQATQTKQQDVIDLVSSYTTSITATTATASRETICSEKPVIPLHYDLTMNNSYESAHQKEEKTKNIEDEKFPVLCRQWHNLIEQTRNISMGEPFVDTEFPPTPSSLDGRQRRPQVYGDTFNDESSSPSLSLSQQQQKKILCHCGLPATARRVQSDGQNYGRFYLVCGKPRTRQRKQKPKVPPKKTTAPAVRNPYAKKKEETKSSSSSEPSKNNNNNQCKFFEWDKDGSKGTSSASPSGYASSSSWSKITWYHFGPKDNCVLYRTHIGPDQIRQGSVGNCWFLSALSVVAEKPYLVQQVLPHRSLNNEGCYQINMCLDGLWKPVIVDSSLPTFQGDVETKKVHDKHQFRGGAEIRVATKNENGPSDENSNNYSGNTVSKNKHASTRKSIVAIPAFAAIPQGQLWPALVEKAYAKAHGSYANLSGGFICEAFSDLTGAPTETIHFGYNQQGLTVADTERQQHLWARLLSFAEAGFLMGIATFRGENGLVPGHAYSLLEVFEIHDTLVGEQQRVTDFFQSSPPRAAKKFKKTTPCPTTGGDDNEVVILPNNNAVEQNGIQSSSIRLVRIRNPWGTREWKGDWSHNSDKWTRSLRKRLGQEKTFAKGDGTFFMSFEDMVRIFDHLDVAKCQKGWVHSSFKCSFGVNGHCPMTSSDNFFSLRVAERTWSFVSLIQPKKRANTKNQYWYCDVSLILMKRRNPSDDWVRESCSLNGISRSCDCEVFLDPSFEYCCIPFSLSGGTRTSAASSQPSKHTGADFRLTIYSSSKVSVERRSREFISNIESVSALHRELFRIPCTKRYVLGPKSLLMCVYGNGCIYFMAINSSPVHFLQLRLVVKKGKGVVEAFGRSGETHHDIRPNTEKILLVLCSDGKLNIESVTFSYATAMLACQSKGDSLQRKKNCRIGGDMMISTAGDLLSSVIDPEGSCQNGRDTLDLQRCAYVG